MEITSTAYQDIRDYVEANWTYIELRDESSVAILRLALADARVSWTHVALAQTLELSVTITGADVDITIPQTFASSHIYKVSTAGSPLSSETFSSNFTIQAEADELHVKHQIEIPTL